MKRLKEAYDNKYELYGYLSAVLFTSDDEEGNPLEDNYDVNDFNKKSIKEAVKDINTLYEKAFSQLEWDIKRIDNEELKDEYQEALEMLSEIDKEVGYQIGIDFWLTRNEHGSGFWNKKKLYGKVLSELLNKVTKDNFREKYAFENNGEIIIE